MEKARTHMKAQGAIRQRSRIVTAGSMAKGIQAGQVALVHPPGEVCVALTTDVVLIVSPLSSNRRSQRFVEHCNWNNDGDPRPTGMQRAAGASCRAALQQREPARPTRFFPPGT